ncbi:hypothetical protein OHB41_01600 [Streptomyces sp. NBC_01571]|uniref:hypothetical protein n=1 Tax=Streptomyces sp. NBC_01571 TaxID=2975883 RepID=UPI00225570AE|nr:hypothetical protein [Streptomyces sp. NBC_01571]MCX4571909.1 hypothetical protein [Streptomyces sp. NBC_01571]
MAMGGSGSEVISLSRVFRLTGTHRAGRSWPGGQCYVDPSGSRTDSPGIRPEVVQRAAHTEERSYGSSATGGQHAADFARRVDAAAGDATAAIHQWLVETGRIRPDHIIHLEVRTWRAR